MPFYDNNDSSSNGSSESSSESSSSSSSNSRRTSRATGRWIPPSPSSSTLFSSASSVSSSSDSSSSTSSSSLSSSSHFSSSPPRRPRLTAELTRSLEAEMDMVHKRLLMRASVIRRTQNVDLIRWLKVRSRVDRGLYFLLLFKVEALERDARETERSLLQRLRAMTPAQLRARLKEAREMTPRWWPTKAWLP